MDVTDVLRDRLEPPSGLQRMIALSLAAHTIFAIVLVIARGNLLGVRSNEPRTVMNISLSGAGEGPMNGGMTAAAARANQQVVPQEELKKQDAYAPPAAAKPEMVMPASKVTTKPPKPAPVVTQAPEGARGRTPTKGTEKAFGQALTYTGARGQGFGLSTGGGPGTGSSLEVSDFCCPDYIVTMIERIRSAWQQNQGATGQVLVRFVIQRDGRITDYTILQSSGATVLDAAALRAVATTRTLNPLPAQFPNPTLPVRLNFEYR